MAAEVAVRNVVEAVVEPMLKAEMTAKVPAAGFVIAHSPKTPLPNSLIWLKLMGVAVSCPIATQL